MVIAFFFGVGVVIESVVLMLRKHWPAPINGGTTVTSTPVGIIKEDPSQVNKISHFDNAFPCVMGRPNAEDFLADASLAMAPGLYVCGPVGMVHTLRVAAGQENSTFGFLTRYAIYEESFEM
jgi:hypothetical protein